MAGVPDQITLSVARDREGKRDVTFRIPHIEDVEWGVLETSGQISFIPKNAS